MFFFLPYLCSPPPPLLPKVSFVFYTVGHYLCLHTKPVHLCLYGNRFLLLLLLVVLSNSSIRRSRSSSNSSGGEGSSNMGFYCLLFLTFRTSSLMVSFSSCIL